MIQKLVEDTEALFSKERQSRIMIAAHRGRFGAAIPENTLQAYEIALKYGADILEVDVGRTKDGGLVLMHGPEVELTTTGHGLISELTYEEIMELKYMSGIRQVTDLTVNTLDELLEHFKGRCLINLDRCDDYLDEVFLAVKRHGMVDQVIIKTLNPVNDSIQWLESHDFKPVFMPIITEYATGYVEVDALINKDRRARIPAVELVFKRDDSKLVAPATIDLLHANGFKVWLNAINIKRVLAAGHNDTVSVLGNEEDGWGWLVNRGADILQTDWTMELDDYLRGIGRR